MVVSDRRTWQGTELVPEVYSVVDYYPFGSERNRSNSEGYRFGFNGMMKDNEWKGRGKIYTTEFRQYDSQIGRWKSVDPLAHEFADNSTYISMSNNPLNKIDPNGDSDFYTSEGEYLGNDGADKDNVYVYQGSFKMFMEGSGLKEGEKITKEHLKGLDWFAENHVGSTDPIVFDLKIKHVDFKDLVGTIYAEGTPGKLSAEEAAGIYSVLENRAEAVKSTPLAIAKGGGVYGYAHRGKIDDPLVHKGSKQNAYKGVIMGMTGDKDYSGGGFYWHGEDFGGPRSYSRAHEDYYKIGFRFTSPVHNIWNLKDVKSGKSGWSYKYESTGAAGQTTFMRLTDGWKTANRHTKSW